MADEDFNMVDKLKEVADEKDKNAEADDNKDDNEEIILFDGGIKKKIIRAGTGAKPPVGSKVKVHYTGTLESDGSKFDSSRDRNEPFEFEIGRGRVIKAWDEGVATMKVGERAILTCREDFAYGKKGSPPKIPGGATLIFDIDLLSFGDNEKDITDGDGGVMKIIVRKGEGYQSPNDSGVCQVKYTGTAHDNVFTKHPKDKEVTLNIDEDFFNMPDGLNKALQSMNKGEKATFKVRADYAYGAEGCPDLGIPPNTDIIYTIDLISFKNEKSSWEMDTKEKIASMIKKKGKGNKYFSIRKYAKACDFYKKALDTFSESDMKKDDLKEEEKTEIKKNQVSCHSNTAICKLRDKEFAECIESCDKALEIEPDHVKSRFRRGQAYAYNGENTKALVDLKAAKALKPEDAAIAKMVVSVEKRVQNQKKKERKLYRGMFEKMTLAKGKNAGYPEGEGDSSSSSSSSSSSDDSSDSDGDENKDSAEAKTDSKSAPAKEDSCCSKDSSEAPADDKATPKDSTDAKTESADAKTAEASKVEKVETSDAPKVEPNVETKPQEKEDDSKSDEKKTASKKGKKKVVKKKVVKKKVNKSNKSNNPKGKVKKKVVKKKAKKPAAAS